MVRDSDRERTNTNDRIARSYRSPSPRSRKHRSRRDSSPDPTCLSAFYRKRFGSRSPDDYLNLRLSGFDRSFNRDAIRASLDREFKKMAPFEIKVVHNPEDDGFLAYVNFERAGCAKKIRRTLVGHLRKHFGRRLAMDPTGVLRDQEGKYIPDRFNRIAMAYGDRYRSPPSPRQARRRVSRSPSPRPRKRDSRGDDEKRSSKRRRERSISSEDSNGGGGSKRNRGPRTPSDSPSRSPTDSGFIETLEELGEKYPSTWKGAVGLKKNDYPLKLHRIFGKEYFLQDLLRDQSGNSLKLNISQRLPLDDALYQKMMDFDKKQLALMVAVEGDQSSAAGLVNYLKEKCAAGIASIENGVVYIFAPSTTQEHIVKFFAPRIAVIKPDSNLLLIAVKKNPSATIKSSSSGSRHANNAKCEVKQEVKQEADSYSKAPSTSNTTSKKEPQTPPPQDEDEGNGGERSEDEESDQSDASDEEAANNQDESNNNSDDGAVEK